MKKIIVLLLMPILAYSQIEKGRKMIGGDISFYSDEIQNTFSFQPQFGYFLGSKFVVGSGMVLRRSKLKLTNTPSNSSTLSLSPFIRYYVITKKINPFILLGGNFATILTKRDNNIPNQSALNLGIGNTLFITKNIGLDFTLSYRYTLQSKLNRGLNSAIGFQIFL